MTQQHDPTEDNRPDRELALHFPEGIPGFSSLTRFSLVETVEDGAFQILQSLDDEDIAMVVAVPWVFFPDYAPELSVEVLRDLDIERPEDAVVFCPVSIDAESGSVSLNLLGPFVVHHETRKGRQVVLGDSSYPVRAPIQVDVS